MIARIFDRRDNRTADNIAPRRKLCSGRRLNEGDTGLEA
jgi:hypothetical protein